MSGDRQFEEAIKSGQLNADGFKLVKNWCAHVRIEKFGGVGLVEEMTGLPIGHHSLACDHAQSNGAACWNIRDAALDFYDRNCHDCKVRTPVNVPNMEVWISDRDAAVAKHQSEEEEWRQEVTARLADRQAERAALRAGLPPSAADVIDQIGELDEQRAPELSARLVQTADLAPEAFPPEVVEYVFKLLESQEHWFFDPGLQILMKLKPDPARLARAAMAHLANGNASRIAASVVLSHLPAIDEAQIPGALPALIRMASSEYGPFRSQQRPRIAPLVRLNGAYSERVASAIDGLFDQSPHSVGLAARALTVLAPHDPAIVKRFARDLVSKFVRSHWMPDPDAFHHDPNEDAAHYLLQAVVAALMIDPTGVDALLRSFNQGASESGEARIFSAYCRALSSGRFRRSRPIGDTDRLAIERVVWKATETTNDKVLREIQAAVSYHPRDLIDLARESVDSLLGASILMDDRLSKFDAETTPQDATALAMMEHHNKRTALRILRDNFVSWAAAGAAANDDPDSYLKVLENLPEERDDFAGSMIRHSIELMQTATGLNAVLPHLYAALVGASTARRGYAANAIGEIPVRQRGNMPDLLFEAFITTLTDPYIFVHSSAVSALERIRPPEKFNYRIRHALQVLISAHHKNPDRHDIVLHCISILVERHLSAAELDGPQAAFLVELLRKMPIWQTINELSFLAKKLCRADGFIDLLLSHLRSHETPDYGIERILQALSDIPAQAIYTHRERFLDTPSIASHVPRVNALSLIEILTRAGAWVEAEQLAVATLADISDTVRETPQRFVFELAQTAAAFEHALAKNDEDGANRHRTHWIKVKKLQEANNRERARRPDPLRYFPNTP